MLPQIPTGLCGTGPQRVTHAWTSVESCSFVQYQLRSKAVLYSMESQKILCDVCGTSFTKNKSLLRHVREVHQGMKRTEKSQELADAKRVKIDNTTAVEDNIHEDNATEVSKPDNTRLKNHMKSRLRELANRYRLSDTYDSRNIKDAIIEKFNQPTQVLCFKFVRDSPWREDVKIMVEECFEELIRACIINNSVVIVEHASKKCYTEEELTGWMIGNEVKLMQQEEGKTFGQYVLDYLGQDCFEMICIGPLSVSDVFNEAKLSV